VIVVQAADSSVVERIGPLILPSAQASRSSGAYRGSRFAFLKVGPPPTTASLARYLFEQRSPHFCSMYSDARARLRYLGVLIDNPRVQLELPVSQGVLSSISGVRSSLGKTFLFRMSLPKTAFPHRRFVLRSSRRSESNVCAFAIDSFEY